MKSILSILCAMLAGCATQAELDADAAGIKATRAALVGTRPYCVNERDCAAKWDAAQLWVIKNGDFKIQRITNVAIETFSAPSNSTDVGILVTKEPAPGEPGVSEINLRITSGNGRALLLRVLQMRLDFNRTVSAAK